MAVVNGVSFVSMKRFDARDSADGDTTETSSTLRQQLPLILGASLLPLLLLPLLLRTFRGIRCGGAFGEDGAETRGVA